MSTEEKYDPVYGYEEKKEEDSTEEFKYQKVDQSQVIKNKNNGAKVFVTLILGVLLGVIISSVVFMTKYSNLIYTKNEANTFIQALAGENASSDTKLNYLATIIKRYYYQDVTDEDLINGVYKGLFEALDDPYSGYYTAEEYEDLMVSLTGDYAGIGALLSKNTSTGVVTVSKVYAGTPAEASGLQADDIIYSADGFVATDLDLDQFVSHIRGEAGTDVKLVIYRGEEELEIVCTRANISTPTVEYQMLDENTGYIQLSQFTNNTYTDFVAAMEALKAQGMTQVVFDLRSNGGGLLDSVVEILDYLLPEGTVVYTMDKNGNREDFTSDAANFVDMPMTVLVNGNTASAAEIFTGAIRDYEYGTIIGTNTFGKGIVQSTIPLEDGSAIKLTTESYYTPSGECIHKVGIKPDIELEYEFMGGEDDKYDVRYDNQIQKALEVLNESR